MPSMASDSSAPVIDSCEVNFDRIGADELLLSFQISQSLPRLLDRFKGQLQVWVSALPPEISEIKPSEDGPRPEPKGYVFKVVIEYSRLADWRYFHTLRDLLGLGTLLPHALTALGLPIDSGVFTKDVPPEFLDGVLKHYTDTVSATTTV